MSIRVKFCWLLGIINPVLGWYFGWWRHGATAILWLALECAILSAIAYLQRRPWLSEWYPKVRDLERILWTIGQCEDCGIGVEMCTIKARTTPFNEMSLENGVQRIRRTLIILEDQYIKSEERFDPNPGGEWYRVYHLTSLGRVLYEIQRRQRLERELERV